MRAKRQRYQYQISEQDYNEINHNVSVLALEDGAKQGIAIAMFAAEMALGWRSVRLRRFYDAMQDILHMPDVFGKSPTAAGAIDRMRDYYGLDIDKLDIDVDADMRRDSGD